MLHTQRLKEKDPLRYVSLQRQCFYAARIPSIDFCATGELNHNRVIESTVHRSNDGKKNWEKR